MPAKVSGACVSGVTLRTTVTNSLGAKPEPVRVTMSPGAYSGLSLVMVAPLLAEGRAPGD